MYKSIAIVSVIFLALIGFASASNVVVDQGNYGANIDIQANYGNDQFASNNQNTVQGNTAMAIQSGCGNNAVFDQQNYGGNLNVQGNVEFGGINANQDAVNTQTTSQTNYGTAYQDGKMNTATIDQTNAGANLNGQANVAAGFGSLQQGATNTQVTSQANTGNVEQTGKFNSAFVGQSNLGGNLDVQGNLLVGSVFKGKQFVTNDQTTGQTNDALVIQSGRGNNANVYQQNLGGNINAQANLKFQKFGNLNQFASSKQTAFQNNLAKTKQD